MTYLGTDHLPQPETPYDCKVHGPSQARLVDYEKSIMCQTCYDDMAVIPVGYVIECTTNDIIMDYLFRFLTGVGIPPAEIHDATHTVLRALKERHPFGLVASLKESNDHA